MSISRSKTRNSSLRSVSPIVCSVLLKGASLNPVVESDRYDHGKLIEINSHSLFSKWFSESGKLVQRLFAQVTEMVEDQSCFVVVLIGK